MYYVAGGGAGGSSFTQPAILIPQTSDGYQKYLTGTDKRFQLHPTSTNKVLSLLNRLNKSKAAGLDKISARLIRECADLICIPIRDIFNQSGWLEMRKGHPTF